MLYYAAIHPLGDDLQLGIFLNIFVLFVFFVDQMINLDQNQLLLIWKGNSGLLGNIFQVIHYGL